MNTPDQLPLWFAIPAIILAWSLLITLILRSRAPDPYPDELSPLDVLERTGVHPHG